MPITVTERDTSRTLTDGESHERIYTVKGTADQAEALTALKAEAPLISNFLYRAPCTVEPLYVDSDHPAHCRWTGRAPYIPFDGEDGKSSKEAIALDGIVIRGTTGGGTMHMTHSLHTNASRGRYAPEEEGGFAATPDFKQGINFNGETFDGVDIGLRQFEFTVTKVWADPGDCILDTLYSLSWTVNNAQVVYTDTESGITITLAAGECLFKWADFGRARGDGGLEVTYHMAASPNMADGWMKIGDTDVPAKLGWKYMWVYSVPRKDTDTDRVVQQMEGVYIEQLYNIADHAGLAI